MKYGAKLNGLTMNWLTEVHSITSYGRNTHEYPEQDKDILKKIKIGPTKFCRFKTMSYVCDIKHRIMRKPEVFDKELQDLATFAKVISHPARLAILKYLAETKSCISGDISDKLPLSRSTVSQHLKELRDMGLIQGEIDGLKINYCLCSSVISKFTTMFGDFFNKVDHPKKDCNC